MVYKLIYEWKKDRQHEISMYKYNYNHDEMVRYNKEGNELMIRTFIAIDNKYEELYDLRDGIKKWWNYNTMKVNKSD